MTAISLDAKETSSVVRGARSRSRVQEFDLVVEGTRESRDRSGRRGGSKFRLRHRAAGLPGIPAIQYDASRDRPAGYVRRIRASMPETQATTVGASA
jgi:hypothetical protein